MSWNIKSRLRELTGLEENAIIFNNSNKMRKALSGMKSEEALEQILDMFMHTKDNTEFVNMIRHTKMW